MESPGEQDMPFFAISVAAPVGWGWGMAIPSDCSRVVIGTAPLDGSCAWTPPGRGVDAGSTVHPPMNDAMFARRFHRTGPLFAPPGYTASH